jgi:hypothetical protein
MATIGNRRALRLTALSLAGVALAGVALVACGGSATKGAAPSTTKSSPSVPALTSNTAWGHVLDQVQPDGQVSLATALAAFDTAIGPVPGATAPAGVAAPIESGTLAVAWVFARWAQLSTAQQRAVAADLGTTINTASRPTSQGDVAPVSPAAFQTGKAPPPAKNPNLDCATADSADAGPYRSQVAGIEAEITAHIGAPFTQPVYLEVNTKNVTKTGTKDEALAYTFGCDHGHYGQGSTTGCVVHLEPRLVGGASSTFTATDVHAVLIHELMHCFLYERFGTAYDHMPAWYIEGVPSWVSDAIGGGSDAANESFWISYLDTDSLPLFKRSYDALGFYTHLAETGTDPWSVILPIGRAFIASGNANVAGWKAAGVTQDFLDSWGSGYSQGRYPGTAWSTSGPGLSNYQPQLPPTLPVGDSTPATVDAPAAATSIRQLAIDADVIQVSSSAAASGRVSLGGGNDATLAQTAGINYCSVAAGCQCPSTSAQAQATFTHIDAGTEYAAVTGGTADASVTLTGMDLSTFCAHTVLCLIGTWTTTNTTMQPATVYGTESGGAGATWVLSKNGRINISFAGSAPVEFFGNSITYRGSETGTFAVPTDSTATTGVFDLTSVSAHVTASTGIGGGAIDPNDARPVRGTFTCEGASRLQISAPAGNGASQIDNFVRAGS